MADLQIVSRLARSCCCSIERLTNGFGLAFEESVVEDLVLDSAPVAVIDIEQLFHNTVRFGMPRERMAGNDFVCVCQVWISRVIPLQPSISRGKSFLKTLIVTDSGACDW